MGQDLQVFYANLDIINTLLGSHFETVIEKPRNALHVTVHLMGNPEQYVLLLVTPTTTLDDVRLFISDERNWRDLRSKSHTRVFSHQASETAAGTVKKGVFSFLSVGKDMTDGIRYKADNTSPRDEVPVISVVKKTEKFTKLFTELLDKARPQEKTSVKVPQKSPKKLKKQKRSEEALPVPAPTPLPSNYVSKLMTDDDSTGSDWDAEFTLSDKQKTPAPPVSSSKSSPRPRSGSASATSTPSIAKPPTSPQKSPSSKQLGQHSISSPASPSLSPSAPTSSKLSPRKTPRQLNSDGKESDPPSISDAQLSLIMLAKQKDGKRDRKTKADGILPNIIPLKNRMNKRVYEVRKICLTFFPFFG